jgi:hypothetical protein
MTLFLDQPLNTPMCSVSISDRASAYESPKVTKPLSHRSSIATLISLSLSIKQVTFPLFHIKYPTNQLVLKAYSSIEQLSSGY